MPDEHPTQPRQAAASGNTCHHRRPRPQRQLAGAGVVGQQRVAIHRHDATPAGAPRAFAAASSTAATPTRRLPRSSRPSPCSKAPKHRWPSPAAWARSAPSCSRCAARAATSSPSASCTRRRSRSCRARARASASRSRSSTEPSPAPSPPRCNRAAPCSPSPRRRRTRCWNWSTSTSSARCGARSPWSTPRSPRPSGQQPLAHGVHLSLHSATKGIAGHNDATLGVVSGERDLLDEIWGYTCCTAPRRRRSTHSTRCAASARWPCAPTTRQPARCTWLIQLQQHPAVDRRALPGPGHRTRSTHLAISPDAPLRHRVRHRPRRRQPLPPNAAGATCGWLRVATSLGGPETLVCHPRTTTHASLTDDEAAEQGVSPAACCASPWVWKTPPTCSPICCAALSAAD
jgi:hypothetical protein